MDGLRMLWDVLWAGLASRAAQTTGSSHGPWWISRSPDLSYALPGALWDRLGLPRLIVR